MLQSATGLSAEDGAVHIEDLAQVFGVYPEDKYKKAGARSIATVTGAECGEDDVAELIRRLTFNTLIGNADTRLKNWSLIYPDRRNAALAPAYDFVSTIAYIEDNEAALKFSRTRRFDRYSEDELSHLAAKALLPEKLVLDTARETVALFYQHWNAEKANLPLPGDAVKAVEDNIKTVSSLGYVMPLTFLINANRSSEIPAEIKPCPCLRRPPTMAA